MRGRNPSSPFPLPCTVKSTTSEAPRLRSCLGWKERSDVGFPSPGYKRPSVLIFIYLFIYVSIHLFYNFIQPPLVAHSSFIHSQYIGRRKGSVCRKELFSKDQFQFPVFCDARETLATTFEERCTQWKGGIKKSEVFVMVAMPFHTRGICYVDEETNEKT